MDDRSNLLLQASAPAPKRNSRAARVSFALAIGSLAGLLLGKWAPAAAYLFWLFGPAIVAGHFARREFGRRPGAYANEGMATFGLAIGYFGLFISILIAVSIAFGMISFRKAQ